MTMTTLDHIRMDREHREKRAAKIAATLPLGDYYASDDRLMRHSRDVIGGQFVYKAATHWDACLIMLAMADRGDKA